MRIPLRWLGEYVQLTPGTTVADVHAALVGVGFEEEGSHGYDLAGPIVVGEVVAYTDEEQKNGKTIRWCSVRVAAAGEKAADGGADVRGIVCGANNFVVGDKVVVTLPGARLPSGFQIAARTTYGHVSEGMIASARELGLGDEHDGILRLTTLGLDPAVGSDALELLGLDDAAVEVNVTPDRGYAFSIRGIAREYAHATGAAFRDPALLFAPAHSDHALSGFSVHLDDHIRIRGRDGSSVFVCMAVRNVEAARPSPPWLVSRLTLAGIRPVSLIVDLTNYVMLELGQPLHGYDLDALVGGLTVRRAHQSETLRTLDGQLRQLHPEDLVIADDSGAIGLAGVMGGASTEITPQTTNVLIEAANFDPVSVARTARRHKLPSEAAKRFERSVDPNVAVVAVERVAQLLEEYAGAQRDALGFVHHAHPPLAAIELPDGYISELIGVEYTQEEIRSSLTDIGAHCERTEGGFAVTPPSWRPDLTHKSALAEEAARLLGYSRIPSILPTAPPGRGLTREQQLRRRTAQLLADLGLSEVLAYPFVSQESNTLFGSAEGVPLESVKVANPLDVSASYLRRTLIPGLLQIAKRNLSRGLANLALFELGAVFLPEQGVSYAIAALPPGAARPTQSEQDALAASLPAQPWHIAALFVGDIHDKQPGQDAVAASISEGIQTVRLLSEALAVPVHFRQAQHHAFHPGRTAQCVVEREGGDICVGYVGELLPEHAVAADLPRVVVAAELNLTALITLAAETAQAKPLSNYPAATQDLTLVVSAEVSAADVRAAVIAGAGALLEDIRLVDDYRGGDDASRALTFALRFRSPERTLTAAEATEAKMAGVAQAQLLFDAHFRQ